MSQPQIPFIKPRFPEPEKLADDLRRIYKNNYYSNNGPVYKEFKQELEAYLGQGISAVVVSNATLGLMLAMHAVFGTFKGKKKYVAVPSFTFAAGPLAIRWCGFEPVFYDVDAHDAQPDHASINEVLRQYGDELAGVLLTNSFGIGSSNMNEIETLLNGANVPFVVDSAPGLGSTYADGALVGGKGACEVFSLHATKPFGIGEGGVITTRDRELAERLESLKNFGFDDEKQTVDLGMNAKITELDCAIGLRILAEYETILSDRRNSYRYYEANLGEGVAFLPRAATAAIQFATILVPAKKRPKVLEALQGGGVEARTYYAPAVHTFPFFSDCPRVDLSHTDDLSARVISLPVHPNMERSDMDHIIEIINQALL